MASASPEPPLVAEEDPANNAAYSTALLALYGVLAITLAVLLVAVAAISSRVCLRRQRRMHLTSSNATQRGMSPGAGLWAAAAPPGVTLMETLKRSQPADLPPDHVACDVIPSTSATTGSAPSPTEPSSSSTAEDTQSPAAPAVALSAASTHVSSCAPSTSALTAAMVAANVASRGVVAVKAGGAAPRGLSSRHRCVLVTSISVAAGLSIVFGVTIGALRATHHAPSLQNGHLQTVTFTYGSEDATGPAHWGSISPDYGTCSTGASQSPVDFTHSPPTAETAPLAPLVCHNSIFTYDIVSRPAHPGFQVQPAAANATALNVGDAWWVVNGRNYTLLQFHFHAPSEHTVNGRHFAAEVHFVHKHVASGGLAVYGMLLDVYPAGADLANPYLASFFDWIHTPTAGVFVDVAGWTSSAHDNYFTYGGSLTTPPCSEAVEWAVGHSPVMMSSGQLEALQFALGASPNARPAQPLFGRAPSELRGAPGPQGVSQWR